MKTQKHSTVTPIAPTTKHRVRGPNLTKSQVKKEEARNAAGPSSPWPLTRTHSTRLHNHYKNLENIQQEINQIYLIKCNKRNK